MAEVLARHMEMEGHAVVLVADGEKGIEEFRRQKVDLVLTDLKLPGKSGLEVLQAVKDENPMAPVVVMTAHGTIETAVKAVKEGAFDFLQKPVDPDHLLIIIGKALEARQLVTENLILKEELSQTKYAKMVGQSRALLEAQDKAKKVAVGTTTVLLLGESGTGKELFARMIHDLSPRKNGPFVAINCAAIPRELLEGERFMRVGGTSQVKADVRVVAATNKDLQAAVAKQAFREDLYYRLNVFPLVIPPLRDRREDIPLLVEHFLAMYSREVKKEALALSSEAVEVMKHHPWTGNIRELQNCIERAVILCDGREILPEHIGLRAPTGLAEEGLPAVGSLQEASSAASRAVEAKMIEKVLRETGGNKTKAAEILQVSYKTLLTKIKDYGLDKE